MEEKIRIAVYEALKAAGAAEAAFAVEWPADLSHGDYATNAALSAAKALGRNPRELADELANSIRDALGDMATSVETAGPGFVNITLAPETIQKGLSDAMKEKDAWGAGIGNDGKTVMIEYSNPNPFKEMHIGHLMSNVVGEALSRLIEASGARVLRDTFGGDVGPHVAKALWALKGDGVTEITDPQQIGRAYITGSNAYEENEKSHEEIDALNTKIYEVVGAEEVANLSDEDRALLDLWRRGREVSMEEFARLFAVLGTKLDYIFYDSDTTKPGIEAVRDGLARGVFEESDGAIIYPGEKKGLHTLVFITSRGTPTYETKDIGLAILKEERHPTDEVIILTGMEQIGHFKIVLAALGELMPEVAKKMTHASHGLLQLTTGKMSSRKGNIITAAGLIRDMIERAQEKNEDPLIAEQVAVGAIKYMILRQAAGGNIIFDPEKSLSLEGESGPYLQYALVRAKSILAQAEGLEAAEAGAYAGETLARLIARFPEVVARAEKLRAPHALAQYLTQLAGEWNSFYARERIIGTEDAAEKLALVRAFAITLENGLRILGIPAPEKM